MIIKRYPNRKLYDTSAKRYITLKRVAELIRQGEEIHVVDYATGEDLTTLTLTQVISEREKKQGGFVPRTVLAGLVQAGGATLDVVRRAMLLPLDLLRQVDDEIRQRIETLIRQGDLPEEEGRRLLEKLLSLGRHPLDEAAIGREVEKALTERGVPDRSDLQRLMEQIDALTRKVEEL